MSLQLRLWATVGVIVVAGALVFILGTSKLYEQVMSPFEASAQQGSYATAAALVRHGAEAVDAAAKASINENVRGALKRGAPADAEAELLERAGSQGAPTFAALIKPDGEVMGKVGAEVALEQSVKGLPIFADASTGVARDDVVALGGKHYHLAAAPIFEGAALAGVVLLGWAYDAAFADRVSKDIGAPAVLLIDKQRLGSQLPELGADELASGDVGELDVAPLPKFLPVLMPDKSRYKVTTVPVIGGQSNVRMAVLFDRNKAYTAIAAAQALVLAGTLLIAFLQSLLIFTTLRNVSRPIQVIIDHLSQVSQGGSVGILPEASLTGPFLRLGKQVNMLLQLMPSVGRPGAPLGTLGAGNMGMGAGMGGTTPGGGTPSPQFNPALNQNTMPSDDALPSFDGIPGIKDAPLAGGSLGKGNASPPAFPQTGPTPASPGGNGAMDFNKAPPQQAEPPPSGLSGLFDSEAPDPLAAFRVPAKGAPPPQPQPPPQPEPPAPQSSMSPEATVMFQVPQELLAQSAQVATNPGMPAVPRPAPPPQHDDARTVIAAVPQELLSQTAGKPDGVNNADEAHYREVYDKFVETRVQCGEDTSDLTYDRFVAKLLKNRQQIIEKHKAKSVRFQVYVKEGKAALRALPVRE